MTTKRPPTILELLNAELDAGYRKTAMPMLQQIQQLSTSPTGEMQSALRELDVEAVQRVEAEQRFTQNDAHVRKALAVYLTLLVTTQSLILANDDAIQASGIQLAPSSVTARVFFALSNALIANGQNPAKSLGTFTRLLQERGVPWNVPSFKLLSTYKAADFIRTQAYRDRMAKWGEGYWQLTRRTIQTGIFEGKNPREIARLIRQHAENVPKYAAENLTRTLQLTAYREASLAMEHFNGQFIQKKIRIARLDDRTCLSCIDLHGSELAPGQRVDDHYRGRCTEFYVVPGGPERPELMQADSTPGNRRYVPFQSGSDWFKSLPEARQKAQTSFVKSPGKWNAYQTGTPLSAFVTEHQDDVFGRQVLEGSLQHAVGTPQT